MARELNRRLAGRACAGIAETDLLDRWSSNVALSVLCGCRHCCMLAERAIRWIYAVVDSDNRVCVQLRCCLVGGLTFGFCS